MSGGIQLVTIHRTNVEKAYDTAKTKAKQLNRPVLLSIVESVDTLDPLDFYFRGSSLYKGERFLWKDRDHTISLVGLGAAHMISTQERTERFFSVEKEWKRFIEEAVIVSSEKWEGTGPLLFGGFTFDPLNHKGEEWKQFSNGSLQLPRFMLTKAKEANLLTINYICNPGDDEVSFSALIKSKEKFISGAKDNSLPQPPVWLGNNDIKPDEWKQSVQNVVNQLKQGKMDKVVLARKSQVTFEDTVSSDFVLDNLWKQQPDSFIFSFERENSCFIGATPERLVKKQGDEILSTCLAGSIARGKNVEEDEKLGEELLHDEKNRYEHQLVVDSIKRALAPYCDQLSIPAYPHLMKMKDIQHLYTPVIGEASDQTSLLNLVEKLHPTPALGGVPREKALAVIRQEEEMDRGLYAGPVGWLDAYGNGEFAVAIRSGLLHGDTCLFICRLWYRF